MDRYKSENYNTTASVPAREPEIPGTLNALQMSLEVQSKLLEQLKARLIIVLRTESSKNNDGLVRKAQPSTTTELGSRIQNAEDHVLSNNSKMEEILTLLEL